MSKVQDIRKKLNQVSTLLKQEKILSAVNNIEISVRNYLSESLMQNEKKEFQKLIEDAIYYLNNNQELRTYYPILLEYSPDNERELLSNLNEIQKIMQENVQLNLEDPKEKIEKEKKQKIKEAKELLAERQIGKAQNNFTELENKYNDDPDLMLEIVDIWINAGHYDKSIALIKRIYKNDIVKCTVLLNRLGIALRKKGKLEDAKKAYTKALKMDSQDASLHFNFGRIFLENKEWDKVMEHAKKALEINAEFKEALKLYKYAEKRYS